MYLSGSKWNMNKRRRHSNPWRILVLLSVIGFLVYLQLTVIPEQPPLFLPTPTATRSPDSFINEAENYLVDGKISQAIESYQNAILADPKNVSNYINISRLLAYSGEYEEAATQAENALLLNPNNSMALALRGWVKGLDGDYLAATDSLKNAITYDPNNSVAYAYYAEVLTRMINEGQGEIGTLEEAIEYSRKAQELAPTAMETHRARGMVLEITSNYAEAADEFLAAINQNDNIADLHLALGRNYFTLKRYNDAVTEYVRANSLNPGDYMPEYYISRTYARNGDYVKGIQYAEQAVNDNPEYAVLYANLGKLYYSYKQFNRAIDAFRMAIQGGTTEDGVVVEGIPLDYGDVAEYYYLYGISLAREGECAEALQIAQALVQIVPDDAISVANAEAMNEMCQIEASKPFPTATPTVTNNSEIDGETEATAVPDDMEQ